jgi:hypothetical protein
MLAVLAMGIVSGACGIPPEPVWLVLPARPSHAEEVRRTAEIFAEDHVCALDVRFVGAEALGRSPTSEPSPVRFIVSSVTGAAASLPARLLESEAPVIVSIAPEDRRPRRVPRNVLYLAPFDDVMRDAAIGMLRRAGVVRSVVLITPDDPRPEGVPWPLFIPGLEVESVRIPPEHARSLDLGIVGKDTAVIVQNRPWILESLSGRYGARMRIVFGGTGMGDVPSSTGSFAAFAVPCEQTSAAREFSNRYEARFGAKPYRGFAFQTYAALQMIDDTITGIPRNLLSPGYAATFMRDNQFKTLLGPISFHTGVADWDFTARWRMDNGHGASEQPCAQAASPLLRKLAAPAPISEKKR